MLTHAQKLLLFSHLLVGSSQAKCPFGFGASSDDKEDKPEDHALPQLDEVVINSEEPSEHRQLQEDGVWPQYPSDLFMCSETPIMRTVDNFSNKEYMEVAESVIEAYDDAQDKNAFAGCLVRLAGHDLMDFRYVTEERTNKAGKKFQQVVDKKGGVDGCVNFADKDNMGLAECIEDSGITEAYNNHCGVVSLADFIVIAAEVTMARTSNSYRTGVEKELDDYYEGSLAKTFMDNFKYGRVTAQTCDWNKGLMPDPEEGCKDVKEVFMDHMFKYQGPARKRLTAALIGAHTIGRAHHEFSGYDGTWSGPGSEGVFDNDFYRQLLTRGWGPDRAVFGNTERNQWQTIDSGAPGGLMLNSDLCLAYDNNSIHQKCMADNNNNNKKCKKLQNKGVPINALHSQCCAWTNKGALFNKGVFNKADGAADLCGTKIPARGKEGKFNKVQEACCANAHADSMGDCDSSAWPKGMAFKHVLEFAADENQWLESFTQGWKIATENGHLDLQTLSKEDDEDEEHECGKLRTRRFCETDPICAWQKSEKLNKRGKKSMHCDLASKAPPKPPKKVRKPRKTRKNKKMKKNDNKDKN